MRTKKVITNNRVKSGLDVQFKRFLDKENIPEQITKQIENHSIKKGRVIEVYHYLDTSLVELSDKTQVEAYHLHRCLGSIVDLYTPEGELGYSATKHEPCILPKYDLKCLVAEVGKDEYVLLGYYNPNMVGNFNPADIGTYVIKTVTDTSQGGLTVAPQEIKLTSNNGVQFKEQDLGESTEINYADSEDTYTKLEVYNKTEIDLALKEIWDYIRPDEGPEDEYDDSGE